MAKDFKSPAEMFLSNGTTENLDRAEPVAKNKVKDTPERIKPNPAFIETKSKRVQVLVQPSTHTSLKAIAEREQTSINEIINIALKDYIEREK